MNDICKKNTNFIQSIPDLPSSQYHNLTHYHINFKRLHVAIQWSIQLNVCTISHIERVDLMVKQQWRKAKMKKDGGLARRRLQSKSCSRVHKYTIIRSFQRWFKRWFKKKPMWCEPFLTLPSVENTNIPQGKTARSCLRRRSATVPRARRTRRPDCRRYTSSKTAVPRDSTDWLCQN